MSSRPSRDGRSGIEEPGAAETVDPLAGSYYLESLTDRMEQGFARYLETIEGMGGMVEAVKRSYPQREIADAAFEYQQKLEKGEKHVVGVTSHTATVGGVKITEPAADLAVALAVASAARDFAVPADLIALGEVGLAGEVRRVSGVKRRLAEAARLGIRRALVPTNSGPYPDGINVTEVTTVAEAIARANG